MEEQDPGRARARHSREHAGRAASEDGRAGHGAEGQKLATLVRFQPGTRRSPPRVWLKKPFHPDKGCDRGRDHESAGFGPELTTGDPIRPRESDIEKMPDRSLATIARANDKE